FPIASTLAIKLSAVITTPRGVPVLPDVYWIRFGSSPRAGCASGALARSSERGSIRGSFGSRSPDSRRWAAVRRSAKTAEGEASLHEPLSEPAAQWRRGKAAPLELIRHQRPVTVQYPLPFESLQRMPAHPAGGKRQFAPDRLGEEGRDARPDALEDEVLHLRRGAAAENARERFAQLLAVREVSGLVLEVDAQHGREQRLARLPQQRRHQRGGRPLADHLADEQLHLRRGARLDGVERRPQLVAGGIQDARLLREIPLQGEIVLRFLLRHHGEKLAVGR